MSGINNSCNVALTIRINSRKFILQTVSCEAYKSRWIRDGLHEKEGVFNPQSIMNRSHSLLGTIGGKMSREVNLGLLSSSSGSASAFVLLLTQPFFVYPISYSHCHLAGALAPTDYIHEQSTHVS